jgi:hypothetical protein
MKPLPYVLLTLLFAVTTAWSTLRAQENDADETKVSELHRSLLGAWVLVGTPGITLDPAPDAEMKFWGLRHFAVTKRNNATGKILYHHVGTYTLDGDLYTETITHAIGETEDLTGQSFKFQIQTKGDTYIQRGIGNPWTQQWKRLVADDKSNDDSSSDM